jgi:hypothetical protein
VAQQRGVAQSGSAPALGADPRAPNFAPEAAFSSDDTEWVRRLDVAFAPVSASKRAQKRAHSSPMAAASGAGHHALGRGASREEGLASDGRGFGSQISNCITASISCGVTHFQRSSLLLERSL